MSGIIKEEEAGGIVCPVMSTPDKQVMCLGAKCAGWLWSRSEQTNAMTAEVVKRSKAKIAEHPELKGLDKVWKDEWSALLAEIKLGKRKGFEKTEGYCGVAGNPNAALRV